MSARWLRVAVSTRSAASSMSCDNVRERKALTILGEARPFSASTVRGSTVIAGRPCRPALATSIGS